MSSYKVYHLSYNDIYYFNSLVNTSPLDFTFSNTKQVKVKIDGFQTPKCNTSKTIALILVILHRKLIISSKEFMHKITFS